MKGVAELYKQNEQQGLCRIEKFTISNQEAAVYNWEKLLNGWLGMNVSPGEYVKLYVNGRLYMSDTDIEELLAINSISSAITKNNPHKQLEK